MTTLGRESPKHLAEEYPVLEHPTRQRDELKTGLCGGTPHQFNHGLKHPGVKARGDNFSSTSFGEVAKNPGRHRSRVRNEGSPILPRFGDCNRIRLDCRRPCGHLFEHHGGLPLERDHISQAEQRGYAVE